MFQLPGHRNCLIKSLFATTNLPVRRKGSSDTTEAAHSPHHEATVSAGVTWGFLLPSCCITYIYIIIYFIDKVDEWVNTLLQMMLIKQYLVSSSMSIGVPRYLKYVKKFVGIHWTISWNPYEYFKALNISRCQVKKSTWATKTDIHDF